MEWRGELDVIAVEDLVLCPGGQATTLLLPHEAAVAEALVGGPVLFVARRPGRTARRGRSGLYRVGTIATVTMTRLPDGSLVLTAYGLARAAVEAFRGREPFLVARCRTLPDPPSLNDAEAAAVLELRTILDRIAPAPPDAVDTLRRLHPVDRAWALVDLVMGGLMGCVEDRQRLLETADRLERLTRALDFARCVEAMSASSRTGPPGGYLH